MSHFEELTIPDWQTRLSIARREARDFGSLIATAYVGTAVIAGGIIGAAHWLFGASVPALIIISLCLAILCIGVVVSVIAGRHYVQLAFNEMTMQYIEGEIKGLKEKLDALPDELRERFRLSDR